MAIDDATNEMSFHKDLDAGLNGAMSSSKLSSNHARSRKILSVSSQKSFHKPQFSATPTHRNIDREHSDFDQLSTSTEVLFTGIKVIDLIEPYAKGGKIGLFGGAGVGKTVLI